MFGGRKGLKCDEFDQKYFKNHTMCGGLDFW